MPNAPWALFKEQRDLFLGMLRRDDPDAATTMLHNDAPTEHSNWFGVFWPSCWGRPSKAFGIHYTLGLHKNPSTGIENLRLACGVESPLQAKYKEPFIKAVVAEVEELRKKGFMLWPQAGFRPRTKLLDAPLVKLDGNSAATMYSYYSMLSDFNALVAEKIRSFIKKDAFSSKILFS